MAIAVDGSTPALANSPITPTNNSTATTASFTPPAGAVLVCLVASDSNGVVPTITFTDSLGTHLTYAQRIVSNTQGTGFGGSAEIWTAVVGASAAMTVSATTNGGTSANLGCTLQVIVLSGANGSTMGKSAVSTEGNSTFSLTYTSTAIGSVGFMVYQDDDGSHAAPTSGQVATGDTLQSALFFNNSGVSGFTVANVRETTAATSAGQTITLGLTNATTVHANVCYLEILIAAAATNYPRKPINVNRGSVNRAANF